MKILITGATGFVGSWMSQKLLNEGHEVHWLVRKAIPQQTTSTIVQHIGDVTQLNTLKNSFKDVEAVFHLAGHIGYTKSDRTLMEQVNVMGTLNVLEACKVSNIKTLLYMSSVVAIGASHSPDHILNENSIYDIESLNLGYFETKRLAEIEVIKAHERGLLEATILNPSTIYGPGDATKGSRKTQIKVAQGKMPFYTSGGVSIIHISDMIEACYNAFRNKNTGERFILSGENVSIRQLFELISEAAGQKPPNIYLPNIIVHLMGQIGDCLETIGKKGPLNSETASTATLYHWFDNSKAKKILNLKQRPAKDAISESVNWMRENKII